MELPIGWRLGRLQNGFRSLFYNGVFAAKLVECEEIQQTVENLVKNPPAKVYVELFKSGNWNSSFRNVQGLRNLVKAGFLSAEDSEALQPKIRPWLLRNRYIKVDHNQLEVEGKGGFYKQIGHRWYFVQNGIRYPLPKKAHFKSMWDCRVLYAKGEATLSQVASYSWGAVLECIGDKMQTLPDFSEATLKEFSTQVKREIGKILLSKNQLCGFRMKEGKTEPIYYFSKLKTGKRGFFDCLDQVLNCEISGYCARLILTNSISFRIQLERKRWDKQHRVYIPFLANRRKLDSMTLVQARNWVQKSHIESIIIGAFDPEDSKFFFNWRGINLGISVKSGKLFLNKYRENRMIPSDFFSWDKDKRDRYLEASGIEEEKRIQKRVNAFYRMYGFLKAVCNVPARKAWIRACQKHLKLEEEFVRKRDQRYENMIAGVNRTAIMC